MLIHLPFVLAIFISFLDVNVDDLWYIGNYIIFGTGSFLQFFSSFFFFLF